MTDKDWLSLISEQNTAKFLFNGYESTYIYIIILIFCHHADSLAFYIEQTCKASHSQSSNEDESVGVTADSMHHSGICRYVVN
jgi:hypothetical protein